MAAATVPSIQTTTLGVRLFDRLAISEVAAKTVYVLAVTVLAVGLRAAALSTYGFSEDEINKVRAIEQYRQGHFIVNVEHPMLMKLAMWSSVELARAWNDVAPASQALSIEAAIRLPNVVVGAATTVVLFGLSRLLFGPAVAMTASLLWALDVNAIAINRIGKEDTFALFFFLVAVWCYERGKRYGATDPDGAQRWYTGSGGSFGLMLASKYFLHYLGIYALFNAITDRHPGANRPQPLPYFGAMTLALRLQRCDLGSGGRTAAKSVSSQ